MADRSVADLLAALSRADQYPYNLLVCREFEHTMRTVSDQLRKRSLKLFCPEPDERTTSKAALVFWDLFGETEGFLRREICDAPALERHLRLPIDQRRPDPQQRMVFVHAPNSRERLNVSRRMFMQLLTYHNVMPIFLEYVFPFGRQHYSRDFHLMGFRSQSQIHKVPGGLKITELARSGRHLEFCYSLKSVESSPSQRPLPWSIRQSSVYHSLDLVSGKSTWIVVKANKVISEAMERSSKHTQDAELADSSSRRSPLAASIELHEIVCSWVSDNWHWYINDLETHLQEITRRALASSAEPPNRFSSPTSPILAPTGDTLSPRTPTLQTLKKTFSWRSIRERTMSGSTYADVELSTYVAPTATVQDSTGFANFSFDDLQKVSFVDETINEALLVLENDISVMRDLVEEYEHLALVLRGEATPLFNDYEPAITSLNQHVLRIEKHLAMQMSRLSSLRNVAADRKSLLNGILQYRGVQASEFYAERAQDSAQRIEQLTNAMNGIAEKTRRDTVSMKIITWVTMAFLPGTFVSTLMSTPIVDFDDKGDSNNWTLENIGVGALKLYLAVSLPLVLLTFMAYGVFKFTEKRKREQLRTKEETEKTSV